MSVNLPMNFAQLNQANTNAATRLENALGNLNQVSSNRNSNAEQINQALQQFNQAEISMLATSSATKKYLDMIKELIRKWLN